MEEIAVDIAEEATEFEEGMSEISAEEAEELEPIIEEAKAAVEELLSNESVIKDLLSRATTVLKNLGEFVAKNVAIGVILWGVNVALSKIYSGHDKGDKHMHDLVKSVLDVVTTETQISAAIAKWLKDHSDDTVKLEGLEIPLESIIYKYMQPVSNAVDEAFSVAKSLKEKIDGSIQYKVPTVGDMQKFLVAADNFLKALSLLVAFINTNVQKFPDLSSFPVKKGDIDNFATQIAIVKAQLI